MKMFSKIANSLQNQFTKKLICHLISQPIFKVFQQIIGYFNAIPIAYNMDNYEVIFVFIVKKLNFKTCGVTFYPFQKVVSSVKTGDFSTTTL